MDDRPPWDSRSPRVTAWKQLQASSVRSRLLAVLAVVTLGTGCVIGGLILAADVREDSRRASARATAKVVSYDEAGLRSVRNARINVTWTDAGRARRASIPVFVDEYALGDQVRIRYDPSGREGRVFLDDRGADEDRALDASLMLEDAVEWTWISGLGTVGAGGVLGYLLFRPTRAPDRGREPGDEAGEG